MDTDVAATQQSRALPRRRRIRLSFVSKGTSGLSATGHGYATRSVFICVHLWFLALLLLGGALGCSGPEVSAGKIEGARRSDAVVDARRLEQAKGRAALGGEPVMQKQILFGDLHVHSTFSVDAFMYALPLFNGEGAHPPADACDFARYCAGLDFFSINDHAEGLTPEMWRQSVDSIRRCNEIAGDPENPDVVAFMGWEWTQTSSTPENHYGHKNVIFSGLADDELPARPISSIAVSTYEQKPPPAFVMNAAAGAVRLAGYSEYADVLSLMTGLAATPDCPSDVASPQLPADCRESAATPEELFRKLREWNLEPLVIPHGLAWGIHAPPGARLDVQLAPSQHDPSMQRLIEISSGHGNSEEYRDFAEFEIDRHGQRVCPEPTENYLPCCWQAGEIMRKRCANLPAEECERRVEEARQLALDAGVSPDLVFPDTRGEDWLDCDQCRDCFKPAMTLRPGMTAQYGAALSNFLAPQADGKPLRFRWGFISSTDNHAARPGTGYKQYARPIMSDARGIADPTSEERVRRWLGAKQEDPQRAQPARPSRLFELFDTERKASFMYPGGIVAVHAGGRDRRSIWDALMRREVYGTSGPRILLWFDMLNAPSGRVPMGSEVAMSEAPRFAVRAAGALLQKPGCPEDAVDGLSSERLNRLCRNECYYPSDVRHRIETIEVVRIRPQVDAGEEIGPLIEDPWRRFHCPPDPNGCRIEFDDPEYLNEARDTVYYVRALQEATPAINAATLRTTYDAEGNAIAIDQCHGGYGTPASDDCLAPAQERAWSSPIYVDFTGCEGQ